MSIRALTYLLMGRDEDALKWARDAARQPAAHCHVHGMFVSALGKLGRIDEAKTVLSEVLRTSPGYSCTMIERILPFKDRRDLVLYLEGQRLAGLPE